VEHKNQEIAEWQENVDDITNWLMQENEKVNLRNSQRTDLETIESKHKREMATIKRERGVAVDKLRKEMLFNIRNIKGQMLNMNDEQLQGTTKLTVLQNI
jgi:hypothetical protein